MTREVLTWVGKPLAFELRPGLNRLGRNPTNDFRVADASVSGFHAEITFSEGEIKVRDLGSTNGTYINDVQIEEAILRRNEIVRLGKVELLLEEVSVIAPPASVSTPAAIADSNAMGGAESPLPCSVHTALEAVYRCEVCTGLFCEQCVTVVGHDRETTSTICPSCGGQCASFRQTHRTREKPPTMLGRLTQTLKFSFTRR
ncbi:MAG: FHA domain-containing protein [Verrucomicrobiales bacterium]